VARYLVTGGAGFIGSHLCDALVERGDSVVVVDNFSSGKRANLEAAAAAIEVIEADVVDGFPAEKIGRVDAVIHLAALISGYDSLHEPDSYMRTNVTGLLRVIDFVAANDVPRIVFASSSTVYGAAAAEGLTEDVLPAPMTVYAASKLIGEQLLAMYSELHGFSYCCLRLFNVYGPRQATDHPYANVTCKFSYSAAHGLPIVLYGDGEQSRDFVFVADVVKALLLVLPASPSPVYNIGTGRETSINELIETLEQFEKKALQAEQQSPWPNDIRRISADTRLARDELGFEPEVSLRDGLARTVDFFRGI
jgi:UDP-glucose 4-epimerase